MAESDTSRNRQDKMSVLVWLSFRSLRSHSGGALVDPALPDSVEVLLGWKEYFLPRRRSTETMHSMVQAGLVAGGNDTKEGRQTVFLTALDPQGQ